MSVWDHKQGLIAYTLTALFLCYEMALQVAPSVITPALIQDLGLNANDIGLIGSAYFYAYAAMQIPVGLLFDRFDAKTLLLSAIMLCITGQWLFLHAGNQLFALMFGRFLEGLGSAFAFVSVLMVADAYFPNRYFALLVGIAQLLAAIGAMGGTAPLSLAVSLYSWQSTLMAMILIGGMLGVSALLYFPSRSQSKPSKKPAIRKTLKHLIQNKRTLGIALYAFSNWAPITIFAALWGPAFVAEKLNLTPPAAATEIAMIWIGISMSAPLLGWLSDHLRQRRNLAMICGILGTITSLLLLYSPMVDPMLNGLLLLLFGTAASGQILTFAMMKDCVAQAHIGTAIGFNNMAVVFGGLLQAFVGYLIHLHYHHNATTHLMPHYHIDDYQAALWIIPVCFACNILLCLTLVPETHPKRAQ